VKDEVLGVLDEQVTETRRQRPQVRHLDGRRKPLAGLDRTSKIQTGGVDDLLEAHALAGMAEELRIERPLGLRDLRQVDRALPRGSQAAALPRGPRRQASYATPQAALQEQPDVRVEPARGVDDRLLAHHVRRRRGARRADAAGLVTLAGRRRSNPRIREAGERQA
jgi:hypothetical protein